MTVRIYRAENINDKRGIYLLSKQSNVQKGILDYFAVVYSFRKSRAGEFEIRKMN